MRRLLEWVELGILALAAGSSGCASSASGAASEPLKRAPAEVAPVVSRIELDAEPADTTGASQEALYRRACDLGSALACNNLGATYGLVRGCTNLAASLLSKGSAPERAVKLLDEACAKDDPEACVTAGDLFYAGNDVPKDAARAYAAYDRACALEAWASCASTAWMLKRGEGVQADAERALQRFRASCEHQAYAGCYGLGAALVESARSAAERERGFDWLDLACDHDEMGACLLRARYMARADGTLPVEAQRLFAKACAEGDPAACEIEANGRLPSAP